MPDQDVTTPTQQKVFNFDEAYAQAKKDYPKEMEKVILLDSTAPDFYEKVMEVAQQLRLGERQIERLFQNGQSGTAVASEMNGYQIALIPVNRDADKGQFPGDQYKSAYFCFQHELGHFVVPNAHTSSSNKTGNWREHAADFFAITRGIQEGIFDKQDVVDQATRRGMASLVALCDVDHISTMTLDAVAINPKNIDFLSLDKQQIKAVAQDHAAAFKHKDGTESKFEKMLKDTKKGAQYFTDDDHQKAIVGLRVEKLVEMCKEAPANSQLFYLSARLLDKIIEQGGVESGSFKMEIDTRTPEWQKVKDMIAEKAGDRDIGAKKALGSSSFTRQEEKPKGLVSLVRSKIKPLSI